MHGERLREFRPSHVALAAAAAAAAAASRYGDGGGDQCLACSRATLA